METNFFIWLTVIMSAIGCFAGFYQEPRVRILIWKDRSKVQKKNWNHWVWQEVMIYYSDDSGIYHGERALHFAQELEKQGCKISYVEGME